MELKTISIVVSIYNEEAAISNFFDKTTSILSSKNQYSFEIIFVNDGSTDKSQEIINSIISKSEFKNIKYKTIEFSKNFGHEAAMIAGIDYSNYWI